MWSKGSIGHVWAPFSGLVGGSGGLILGLNARMLAKKVHTRRKAKNNFLFDQRPTSIGISPESLPVVRPECGQEGPTVRSQYRPTYKQGIEMRPFCFEWEFCLFPFENIVVF